MNKCVRRDHPLCRSAAWICMCGRTRDVVIYSRFHRNPFRGFWATEGQNLPLPIDFAIGFYKTFEPWCDKHNRLSAVLQGIAGYMPPKGALLKEPSDFTSRCTSWHSTHTDRVLEDTYRFGLVFIYPHDIWTPCQTNSVTVLKKVARFYSKMPFLAPTPFSRLVQHADNIPVPSTQASVLHMPLYQKLRKIKSCYHRRKLL